MLECDYIDSLTYAEKACATRLADFLGVKVWRDANPCESDCAVFNIGYLRTGELCTFNTEAFHFRASLDLFNRDRTLLQRQIMRLLGAFPINADLRTDDPLREGSNVLVFRVAPESNSVGIISRFDLKSDTNAAPLMTYTACVQFDVVFRAAPIAATTT